MQNLITAAICFLYLCFGGKAFEDDENYLLLIAYVFLLKSELGKFH